ncbi:MAG TPA: polysialyltransferase family glycosyltransferase [Propionibacteriaceae bacterium]|nr:polysialyltransferase family glycosyltransferase [Propionibacteriaceae bacterium]
MSTHVFYASTAFGLATLAAAAEDGLFPDADRRVLVLSNNAGIPETAYGVADVAGIALLIEAFDDVYSYNDAIAPQHPSLWQPQVVDLPIWERSLRSLWALEGDIHLVVESIQVRPALALCQTFADAAIDVYADGLISYGPTRIKLPAQIGMRVERLLHLDLVPKVRPLLLREYGVRSSLISTESFQKVVAGIAAASRPAPLTGFGSPTVVLLGQHLSALQLMTVEEERQLHLAMVETAVAAGFDELMFKTHPAAPPGLNGALVRRADELGARLTVRDAPELVETWYASGEVDLVVGCLSTGLATAALYGVPAARAGTELLLERLNPYETSNRMAATVITATVPPLQGVADGADHRADNAPTLTTEQVVNTVGYLMQPTRNSDLRDAALALLEQRFEELRPYVRRSRLSQLGLPAGGGTDLPGNSEPKQPGPPDAAAPVAESDPGSQLGRRLNSVRRLLSARRAR